MKRVILFAASLAGMALLTGCTSADDRAYNPAELSDAIFVANVSLNDRDVYPGALIEAAHDYELLIVEAQNNRDRVYRYAPDDYRIKKQGLPDTADKILAVVTDDAALYSITLPDPTDTALIEPLFGKKMRRHIMTEPQRGCEVVSGVRDGKLRVGVIAHEVSIKRKAGYSIDELNYNAINLCYISAAMLLHGFPVNEAMNYAPYAINIGRRAVIMAPDFEKMRSREEEIFAKREK